MLSTNAWNEDCPGWLPRTLKNTRPLPSVTGVERLIDRVGDCAGNAVPGQLRAVRAGKDGGQQEAVRASLRRRWGVREPQRRRHQVGIVVVLALVGRLVAAGVCGWRIARGGG